MPASPHPDGIGVNSRQRRADNRKGHQPCYEKSRSFGASDSVKRQCGIGAVEEFDCREHQFGVTHVFEVVKEVFAFGEMKVACLAG